MSRVSRSVVAIDRPEPEPPAAAVEPKPSKPDAARVTEPKESK